MNKFKIAISSLLFTALFAILFSGCGGGSSISGSGDAGHKIYSVDVLPGAAPRIQKFDSAANTVSNPAALSTGGADIVTKPGTPERLYATAVNALAVINPANDTIAATIANVGQAPVAIAFLPDGSRGYVAARTSNNVIVINATNNTVASTIAMPANSQPTAVDFALLPSGAGVVYVSLQGTDRVAAINTSTNTIAANIAVADQPGRLAATPDGTQVWVTSTTTSTITIIDTLTNTVATTISIPSPTAIDFNSTGSKAYVTSSTANANGALYIIDAKQYTIQKTVPVGRGPNAIAMSPARAKLYIFNQGNANMMVFDTATETVTSTVANIRGLAAAAAQ